jgi:hypothetical protein
VGSVSVSHTVDIYTGTAEDWPFKLSSALNLALSSEIGSSGAEALLNTLGRYVHDDGVSGWPIVDVNQENVAVSLLLNGQDYSSQLQQQPQISGNYSGEVAIPHWFASTNRHFSIFVSNESDVDVNVDVDLNFYNGNPFTGSYSSQYAFSGNNPVSSTALLEAGEQGQIGVGYRSGATLGQAKVSWSSSVCVNKPLKVTVAQFSKSGGMSHYTTDAF